MNTFLTLADAGNQTVLGTASVQLGGGSRLESAVGSTVAGLEFSGGTVSLPSITAGDDAPLTVNGDVSFTSGGKIELDGLQVTGTEGLFDAFDLDQALIHFTGSALGYVAELEFEGEASGEIWNDGATPGADPAAYGVWTKNEKGLFIDGNRNISVGLELSELQLALDNGTGLVIDASQADGFLTALCLLPQEVSPTEWMPKIFCAPEATPSRLPDTQQNRLEELIYRRYKEINNRLAHFKPLDPIVFDPEDEFGESLSGEEEIVVFHGKPHIYPKITRLQVLLLRHAEMGGRPEIWVGRRFRTRSVLSCEDTVEMLRETGIG